MTLRKALNPRFVTSVPEKMEEGILYVSMPFATAAHLCCCGCGTEIFTPFTATDWQLTFDGTVSLWPSVGAWRLKCRSHYVIRRNAIVPAPPMSEEEIEHGRRRDTLAKELQYKVPEPPSSEMPPLVRKKGFWAKLFGR